MLNRAWIVPQFGFQLTLVRAVVGRKVFLLHRQKFLLHLLFVRSTISDCRNDREATVKVTSWRRFKVAHKRSRRFGRLNEEVGTVKVSK